MFSLTHYSVFVFLMNSAVHNLYLKLSHIIFWMPTTAAHEKKNWNSWAFNCLYTSFSMTTLQTNKNTAMSPMPLVSPSSRIALTRSFSPHFIAWPNHCRRCSLILVPNIRQAKAPMTIGTKYRGISGWNSWKISGKAEHPDRKAH